MSASDEMSGAGWRERAAFHVSIHSAAGPGGLVIWQTRAYHEESDTASAWPGPPGEALIRWLSAVAALPPGAPQPEPAQPAAQTENDAQPKRTDQPGPTEPADDFAQIIGMSAATAERLQRAGIATYARLAASSPAELGALLDMPPERIARRGWITRARALARLASLPAAPARPAPEPEQPAPSPGVLYVEVLFDEQGAILEQRLLRGGEPPGPDRRWEGGHTARLFVEPAAARGEPGGGVPAGMSGEVELALDELELDELPAPQAGAPQLRARSTLRLAGLGADLALGERPAYLAYVLAHELETGATAVLRGVAGRLGPASREEPLELAFALPEVGRYQMLLVALVGDGAAIGAVAGPRLRVNP